MQHACGMRKISKILMRKLCGKRTCLRAVDGLIKNWEVGCGVWCGGRLGGGLWTVGCIVGCGLLQ
jgi:hypothetical protein